MLRPIVAVLSGAGISAESGLKTFRDAGGLWEGHKVTEVATPEAWQKNPSLVLKFYNERRKQLLEVFPNQAHHSLVDLEEKFDVHIITQNVDDLHERAGSSNVLHLHGELLKARSSHDVNSIQECNQDINIGDTCDDGHQLRPHIVWFGENVPLLEDAAILVSKADYLIIVGTSMQVYPAANLIHYAKPTAPIFMVDPNPSLQNNSQITILAEMASIGVQKIVSELLAKN